MTPNRLVPRWMRPWLRRLRDRLVVPRLRRSAERRMQRPGPAVPHTLPGELIVSLTSYPARFSTLPLTLGCLLDQTVWPDRVVLWIAHEDAAALTPEILALEQRGLEIRRCEDLRSFKKLVPALRAFPDAFIVTADDDISYPRGWLRALVDAAEDGVIPCHRVHRIRRHADGTFCPYAEWERDVQDARAREPSRDIIATSGAGALYAPGSLASIVTDRSKFSKLSPDSDDLWFHWCARMAGTLHKKVGGKVLLTPWDGKQISSLWDSNERGGNDAAVVALQREFRYPD